MFQKCTESLLNSVGSIVVPKHAEIVYCNVKHTAPGLMNLSLEWKSMNNRYPRDSVSGLTDSPSKVSVDVLFRIQVTAARIKNFQHNE